MAASGPEPNRRVAEGAFAGLLAVDAAGFACAGLPTSSE